MILTKNRIAIVTAVCGNLENLHDPSIVHSGVDYIAFVDKKHAGAKVWNQRDAYHFSHDQKYANRRNAKLYKVLPELLIPDYDYYFWVDVSHDVVANPFEIVNQYLSDENPFAVFAHTQRKCVYKEAKILISLGYDHRHLIKEEIKYFKKIRYPVNYGLYELSAFVKKKTWQSTECSLKWWDYLCRYSSRDQISLPVAFWESGIQPKILPGYANGYNKEGMLGNNDLIPQKRAHKASGVK